MTAPCWDGGRHLWSRAHSGYCLACGRWRSQLRQVAVCPPPACPRRAVPLGSLLAGVVLALLISTAVSADHVGGPVYVGRQGSPGASAVESLSGPPTPPPDWSGTPHDALPVTPYVATYRVPTVEEAFAWARTQLSSREYSCLREITWHESRDRVDALNRSGAYGIPQSKPGNKMASALLPTDARDAWRYDPQVQVRWMIGYLRDRYGSACGGAALKFGWCSVGRRVYIAGIHIPHATSPSRPGDAGSACAAKHGVWHKSRGWY